jgi:hypothetical protein
MIAASNAHLMAFDNLSALPVRISDALCRLTGQAACFTGGKGVSGQKSWAGPDSSLHILLATMPTGAVQFRPQRCEAIDRRPLKAIVRRLPNACMHVYGRLSRVSIHQILLAASVAASNSWRAGPL